MACFVKVFKRDKGSYNVFTSRNEEDIHKNVSLEKLISQVLSTHKKKKNLAGCNSL